MTQQQKLSAGLGLAQTIEPTFFHPESKKQRVLVRAVRGYGEDGKGIVLKTKNDAGQVIAEKGARCYAEVDLLDADSLRTSTWQVLSKPAVVQVAKAIDEHGRVEGLLLDVWAEGRGKEKQFHVTRVTDAMLKAEVVQVVAEVQAQPKPEPVDGEQEQDAHAEHIVTPEA